MERLPTNIIQLIFTANIEIWPILRLACKRFLKISKSNYVMKCIVETSKIRRSSKIDILKSHNIYNELLAISGIHYNLYYAPEEVLLGVEDPSFQVQTFYGTFNVYPVVNKSVNYVEFDDTVISPVPIYEKSIGTVEEIIKIHVRLINWIFFDSKEDPFGQLRASKSLPNLYSGLCRRAVNLFYQQK